VNQLVQFVEVILPLPLAGTFTYRVPRTLQNEVEAGKRVVVQFGRKKLYTGIIRRVHDTPPQAYQAKYLDDVLDDRPVVFQHQLDFWQWMHTYYMCHLGDVMNAALPSGLKLSSETRLTVHPDFTGEVDELEEDEMHVLQALQNNEVLNMDEIASIVRKTHVLPIIRNMMAKRVVLQYEELQQKYRPKTRTVYSLAPFLDDKESLETVFETLKKAKKQLDALMVFLQNMRQKKDPLPLRVLSLEKRGRAPRPHVSKRSLTEDGASAAALTALEKKGILIASVEEIGRLAERTSWSEDGVKLTDGQQVVYEDIKQQLKTTDALLLHGVTGSGKTEIYIRLIEDLLEQKKQVLYMLPEIALTTQIVQRLQKHFGKQVGMYHSRMSDSERVEVWQKQLSNAPYAILLGARSALFLPFSNLGMILLDEEHEHTFKQHDPAPRYHTREASSHLTKKHGAKLLLGSATPSIEAYYNAKRGKIGFSHLSKRFGGLKLPHIEVCDLRKERKEQTMKGPFSSQLLQRIKETLDRRLQVIIFQNRRGYSSYVQCDNCGWVPDCLNCDISLTYHKYSQDVRCHYCGHTDGSPNICPKCKATFIKTRGFGTEQVEEELSVHFPEITVARMDLDTTRGKYAYQRIITDFEEQRIHILVGTQMVAKGLDFDHVGLVGILNADQLLNYPDFRAFERAYQLMAQVSGRAGRKGKQGLVVVQTGSPDHFIIEKVVQNDYESMYAAELEQRKAYRYPPFIRMIRIVIKHRDRDKVDAAATKLAEVLQPIPNMLLLGPEYPMVQRIRNQYHKYILLKMGGADLKERKQRIFQLIQEVRSIKEFRSVRFLPDVDPL